MIGGSVSKKTEKACRWRLHNKLGISQLINFINGKLQTVSKILKLQEICKIYEIPIIETYSSSLKLNSWFCGFFDAEDSLNFHKKNVEARLQISQKTKKVLEKIKADRGGNISYDKSWDGYSLLITGAVNLSNLLEYFDKYTLRVKHVDLYYLKKLIEMKNLKYHLPNSEKHSEYLETLGHLKNIK